MPRWLPEPRGKRVSSVEIDVQSVLALKRLKANPTFIEFAFSL
ncbi:hypothetical protein ACE8FZ_19035 [Peribacillus frigoritolerans]